MRERKATVLASLKRQTVEKRELENGYAIKFPGTDSVLDELTEFIKTERECDKGEAWLELTGPAGAKGFIATELGL